MIEHVRHSGIADQSLRSLAEAIGTSHRMLIYHFGSREGLIAEIVAQNEAEERAVAESLATTAKSMKEALASSWQRNRQPKRAGEQRLFFELAAMAMYGRPGTEHVRRDMIDRWMDTARATNVDQSELRLDIAVIRGLLLDLLLTGDREGPTRRSSATSPCAPRERRGDDPGRR